MHTRALTHHLRYDGGKHQPLGNQNLSQSGILSFQVHHIMFLHKEHPSWNASPKGGQQGKIWEMYVKHQRVFASLILRTVLRHLQKFSNFGI